MGNDAESDLFALLNCWDDLDSAINRVVTAQPRQLSEACDRLETTRVALRDQMRKYAFATANAKHGARP